MAARFPAAAGADKRCTRSFITGRCEAGRFSHSPSFRASTMSETAASPGDPAATIRSRRFLVLLVLAALIGVVASLAAWCFLELIHQIQVGVYTDLPKDFGYHSAPEWWSLPVTAIAGVVAAFAIVRLPGRGGHLPADGLGGGLTQPVELPGVILAALATVGLGIVLGPESRSSASPSSGSPDSWCTS